MIMYNIWIDSEQTNLLIIPIISVNNNTTFRDSGNDPIGDALDEEVGHFYYSSYKLPTIKDSTLMNIF